MYAELQRRKIGSDAADHVVDSLIETSLRGVDSHGINLFPHYCQAVDAGRININPNFSVEQNGVSSAILDADSGFGHHAGSKAIKLACDLAATTGIGFVGVKNSSHFGAAAYFAQQAARLGYVGLAFTNADALVKVHNGREAFFGTNPICFAAPLNGEEPLCLDMATSQVAWNRVKNYRWAGTPLENGWAFNAEGVSVRDAQEAVSLAPTGGYKGFGLGLMVEVLCSLLIGEPLGKDLAPMYEDISKSRKISHCFIVINIEKLTSLGRFKSELSEMVSRIRLIPPVMGQEVMVPGDPEKKAYQIRILSGIPVIEYVHDDFVRLNPSITSILKYKSN
jgi:LDH2 family malate/lactate/ureidoglycolate dehydrogenase